MEKQKSVYSAGELALLTSLNIRIRPIQSFLISTKKRKCGHSSNTPQIPLRNESSLGNPEPLDSRIVTLAPDMQYIIPLPKPFPPKVLCGLSKRSEYIEWRCTRPSLSRGVVPRKCCPSCPLEETPTLITGKNGGKDSAGNGLVAKEGARQV